VKLDPDTHKGMNSVLALKLGVIVTKDNSQLDASHHNSKAKENAKLASHESQVESSVTPQNFKIWEMIKIH
jgi:hypothetical protein